MAKKVDLRIIKTKNALASACIKLLEQKNYQYITISDLCNEAGVSRATFYNNFEKITDVFDYILKTNEQKVVNRVKERLLKQKDIPYHIAYSDYLYDVINFFKSVKDQLETISIHNPEIFLKKTVSVLIYSCTRDFVTAYNQNVEDLEMKVSCLAGALTGLAFYFLDHTTGVPTDEIHKQMFNLTFPESNLMFKN